MDRLDNGRNHMADSSVSWKAAVWRINSRLAIFAAFLEALTGDWICFVWLGAAWLEWQIASHYEEKGKQDE